MSEAHDDYLERLEAARLRALIAETGVRVCELAVLFSTFEAIARGALLLEGGGVPTEELPDVPDPGELLAKEEDMTTREAVDILRNFLDMSAKGEAKLWDVLNLMIPD
jgi:hypothetical protein